MSILTFLEKTKETRLTFFQGSVKVVNFQEVRVKITNTHLNKLESAAKNKK